IWRRVKHPTELLVLAGGFGTRLRSIVSEVPKPLAPVGGRPYLHHLIETWWEQGIMKLTFLLHHQADLIKAFLEQRKNETGLRIWQIVTLTEPRPLGTGGAVAYAIRQRHLEGSFLVANADTWLGTGIQEVWSAPVPAMGVVQVGNSERYGSVRIEQGRVVAFQEKQNSVGPGWVNAGLYHLQAGWLDDWNGLPFSLERELFPKLAANGQLQAVPLETDFIDIGIPEDYFRFCRWIESDRQ